MDKDMFEGLTPFDTPQDKPKEAEKKTRKTRVTKTKTANVSTDNLARTLQGLHVVIGVGLSLPELMLTEEDAALQADAIQRVMNEYDIPISPTTQALVNLAFVSFTIYAPRIYMINQRKKAEIEAEKTEESEEQ